MQENDVGTRELLPCFLGNSNIVVLVQRRTNQPDLITGNHSLQLVFGAVELLRVPVALQSYLHPIVALVELYLPTTVFLDLLEQVLTVQPNHLHRIQLDRHLAYLLFRHLSVII